MIREIRESDLGRVAEIYNHYITNSVATFEEQCITTQELESRVKPVQEAGWPWLVAEEQGRVIGYAYATKWNSRCAYRHSVEVSVYLDPEAVAGGWGTQLYSDLFERLGKLPVHAVIAGIALPNAASVTLHEKFGMHQVAHFKEVGFKFGRWLDVGYWQTLLDG